MNYTINQRSDCGCSSRREEPAMHNIPVMCYVPWQKMNQLFEPMDALRHGTAFPELVKPFLGKRGCIK